FNNNANYIQRNTNPLLNNYIISDDYSFTIDCCDNSIKFRFNELNKLNFIKYMNFYALKQNFYLFYFFSLILLNYNKKTISHLIRER
ncbi:hypothetical protein Q604_UNBC08635G0001, partial [human gut metagenome]